MISNVFKHEYDITINSQEANQYTSHDLSFHFHSITKVTFIIILYVYHNATFTITNTAIYPLHYTPHSEKRMKSALARLSRIISAQSYSPSFLSQPSTKRNHSTIHHTIVTGRSSSNHRHRRSSRSRKFRISARRKTGGG